MLPDDVYMVSEAMKQKDKEWTCSGVLYLYRPLDLAKDPEKGPGGVVKVENAPLPSRISICEMFGRRSHGK